MATETQDLRIHLLQTSEEFRRLAEQHQELDTRLGELASRPYLSASDQLEQATLKKRKLQIKDRMEEILRRHRTVSGESPGDSAGLEGGRVPR